MADIPNGEPLIHQLFTSFFDIGAKSGIARQIEYFMSDILVQLVAECNSLPSELVDIIVAQFLRANLAAASALSAGGKRLAKEDGKQTSIREHMAPPPPAYNMARMICTSLSCVDKMARHICQYFSEVILDASPSERQSHHHHHRRSSLSPEPHSSPEPSGPHEPSEDDMKELSKAHLLVKELWRAAPSVLQNVIPQLEQELLAENVQLRLLATETIGDMCAISPSPPLGTGIIGGGATVGSWGGGTGGSGSFASTCPGSWKLWLGRVNDRSWVVRSKWVECAVKVLQTLSPNTAPGVNAAQSLVPLIADKLNDTDERVRLATCRAIGEDLDYVSVTTKLNKANGEKLLENLALRAKDKKHSVRAEGMRVLARMWDSGYEDIRRGDESVIKLLGWIPGRLLETTYVNDRDVDVLLDCVMWEILLPLEYPPGCLEIRKKNVGDVANGKGKDIGKVRGKEKESTAAEKAKKGGITRSLREKRQKDTEKEKAVSDTDSMSSLSDPPESSSGEEEEIDENISAKNARTTLDNDRQRTIRLLHLAHKLSPKSLRALLALASRQLSYSTVLTAFLASASDFQTSGTSTLATLGDGATSQGDLKARLPKLIMWLATHFPDTARAREHLWKWVKMGDRRGWALVKEMLSVEASWVQVVSSLKEVVKRIEKGPGGGGGILETILPLLYRSALLLWNKSHVPTIVAMSKEAAAGGQKDSLGHVTLGGSDDGLDTGLATTANLILKEMSSKLPAVFKAHIASLTMIIQETAPPIPGSRKAAAANSTMPVDPNIVDTLSALSTFARRYPNDVPRDRKLHQALFALATSPRSTPPAAKHAVRALMSAALNRQEMYASDLVQKCVTEWEWGREGFVVQLAAVAEIVMVAPVSVVGEKETHNRIAEICVTECLAKLRTRTEQKPNLGWVEEMHLPDEARAKILALKALVNIVRAATANSQFTTNVITLLKSILTRKGETTTEQSPEYHHVHLRLTAAISLLKLAATSPTLDDLIHPTLFNTLALTAEDGCEQVRRLFLGRLKKLLAAGKLSTRWNTIVFLVANEPIDQLREESAVWIRAKVKAFAADSNAISRKFTASGKKSAGASGAPSLNPLESVIAPLLSLLAHHPDYSNNPPRLINMARYLGFYIRTVVTADNIGVVYYIAGYVKQFEDGILLEKSENLYTLSELTQAMIRRWKEMNEGWTIESWPWKLALPKKLFAKIGGQSGNEKDLEEKRKEVLKKVYLPPDVDGKVLDGVLKEKRSGSTHTSKAQTGGAVANGDGAHGGKKRKSDMGALHTNKKRRQSRVGEEAEDGRDSDVGTKKAKKIRKPRKRRSSSSDGVTPKTPVKTRRRKSGGNGHDDDGEGPALVDAGMSTVERRRSGRVHQKVVYIEDDEGTGEELEDESADSVEDDDGESSEEGGNDSCNGNNSEDGENDDDDKMDVDVEGNDEQEAKAKKPLRAVMRGARVSPMVQGRTRRKITGKSKSTPSRIRPTKSLKNRSPRGRLTRKGAEKDRDGDEGMSDESELSELSEFSEMESENRVAMAAAVGIDNDIVEEINNEIEKHEQAEDNDAEDGEGNKVETLGEALTRAAPLPPAKARRRGEGANGAIAEAKKKEKEKMFERKVVDASSPSPVKQMVIGRVTRRTVAAGAGGGK